MILLMTKMMIYFQVKRKNMSLKEFGKLVINQEKLVMIGIIQIKQAHDPVTGQSIIHISVLPGVKRFLYVEVRQRPGFGVSFVD